MRFHLLAVPHTISIPQYSSCAFTTKVVKLAKMLSSLGHEVIHYGHELSKIQGRHITVIDEADIEKAYPGHNWAFSSFPPYYLHDHAHKTYVRTTIAALKVEKRPGDFLLCTFGAAHQPIAQAHPDLICVESGIGYPGGHFAPYKIFESFAIKHAYHGLQAVKTSSNNFWYDQVIPNAFDPDEFEFSHSKKDYLLFFGRVSPAKGIHIAVQLAEVTKKKLIVAGHGQGPASPYVEYLGLVGPAERAKLLRDASALLCPSTFLEPFCGVQIEAFLSGTPVISSNWGAFAEYNLHNVTGFRCNTFKDFRNAIADINLIEPIHCLEHGKRFSLYNIALEYEAYFKSLQQIHGGAGWYA